MPRVAKRKSSRISSGRPWKKSAPSSRGPYTKSRKPSGLRSKFARAVKSVMLRNMETKEVFREIAVNKVLRHNNVMSIDNNAFYCQLGTRGEDHAGSTGSGTRIGKEVFVKGIKVAINLEALQKRAHTTYWLYLIRSKASPGSTITAQSEIFEGRSTTIPMDYLDTDKCHVLYCKKFTLRMPNAGTSAAMPDAGGSGFAPTWENNGAPQMKFVITNPQIIKKFYVPINKKIIYRDDADGTATLPQAGQQYQWVMVAYDNYSTTSDVNNADSHIGSLHMTTVLKYKDI